MSSDFWCRVHDCEADSMGMCPKCYQMLNKRQQCYQVQIEVPAKDPGLGGVRKAIAVDVKEETMRAMRHICAYCGYEAPEDEVRKHIETCAKHPLSRQLAEARAEVERLKRVAEKHLTALQGRLESTEEALMRRVAKERLMEYAGPEETDYQARVVRAQLREVIEEELKAERREGGKRDG
jgi:hypothetical protein